MTKPSTANMRKQEQIRVEDLEEAVGFPSGKFQPNHLPKLKNGGKLAEKTILALQGPACMLDF